MGKTTKDVPAVQKKTGVLATLKGMHELSLILIILVFGVFLTFASPIFLTWTNLKTVLSGMSTDGIMTIGMAVILISGGLDLSIGSVMCLSMVIGARVLLTGANPILAVLVTVAFAAAIGWAQGMVITKLNLTHFIVTLCTMGMARGMVLGLTGGRPISLIARLEEVPWFKVVGQGSIGGVVPMQLLIFLALAVFMDFMTRKSAPMRRVFYTGSNEKAARYSGIRVDRVKIAACIFCSACAGLASVIYMVKFSGVPVSAGTGAEMTAISSCVIGGCSMNGGKGTIFGALLGLMLMSLVTNAMNLLSVPTTWQNFITYSILLLAVVIDVIQQNRAKKKAS